MADLMSGKLTTARGYGKCQQLSFLLFGLLLMMAPLYAAGFRVLSAETYLDRGVYRLNARVDYQFSQGLLEALQNGVPLILKLRMEVMSRREWLWDEPIARVNQRFSLEYHALARQYVVTNLNSGELKSFPNRTAAVEFLGRLNNFPLLDRSLLKAGENYYVRLSASLEIEALPTPLRLTAYLSGDWLLNSEWYTCPL